MRALLAATAADPSNTQSLQGKWQPMMPQNNDPKPPSTDAADTGDEAEAADVFATSSQKGEPTAGADNTTRNIEPDMAYDDAGMDGDEEPGIITRAVHLAAVQAETAELRDQLMRAVAETQNMRKRMEREVTSARKFAVAAFVSDIVPLTDNFQRAIEAVPADAVENDPALKSLLEGVTLTERQFISVLEKHGVKQVFPKNEIFDPHVHQAIAQFPNPDVPVGTILEVAQAGFVLGERVIRPAMVVVAQGGPKPMKDKPAGGPPPLPEAKKAATATTEPNAAEYDDDEDEDDGSPEPLDFS